MTAALTRIRKAGLLALPLLTFAAVLGVAFGAPVVEPASPYREIFATLGILGALAACLVAATSLRRLEDEAAGAREFAAGLLENLPLAAYVDEVGVPVRSVYASPQLERLLGYKPEEWKREPGLFAKMLHSEDRERVLAVHEDAAAHRRPLDLEYRVIAKDGRTVWVHDQASIVTDDDGGACWKGFLTDVTKRKEAEEALRRLAAQNRLLLEAAGEGIIACASDGRAILVNAAAAAMLGYEPEEVVGKDPHVLFHHTRADGSPYPVDQCPIGAAVRSGETLTRDDDVFWRKDGTCFPVEYTTTAAEEDGRRIGVVTVFRDISNRRAMQDALRESERRYRELFENAHDLIVTTDLEERITSVNPAFERVLGYTSDEAIGMRLTDLQPPDVHGRSAEETQRKLCGDAEATTFELDHLAKDTRRVPLEISSRLIYRDGIAVGTQGVARDLSERRRLEEQLHHAQKMEAVGQLAGGVAHDFNNSLMAIRGYTELLLARLEEDDPLRRHAEGVEKAAEGATSVTRQLLAFSRKQMLQPRVLDLNQTVTELEPMLHRLIGEHITLDVGLDGEVGRVRADPGQLEQVIVNLVVNARDAMTDGGRLTISTSNVELDRDALTGSIDLPSGPYVLLAVTDTGTGMPPEIRDRVFEPFFSTKQIGLGTGLGLSTVYGIVKQSGGTVSVYSEVDRGTCFKVYLPSLDAPTLPARAGGAAAAPRGTESVLLVEDEDSVRALVAEMLDGLGYDVVSAANGTEALLVLKEIRPDVLITDVVMPDMPGPQLAMRANLHRPGTRVIYMSGYTNDTVLNLGARTANVAFLQKPFTRTQLATTVRTVLDGGGRPELEAVSV